MVNNLRTGAGHLNHLLGQFLDAELVGIAQIDRPDETILAGHEANEAVDQVVVAGNAIMYQKWQ